MHLHHWLSTETWCFKSLQQDHCLLNRLSAIPTLLNLCCLEPKHKNQKGLVECMCFISYGSVAESIGISKAKGCNFLHKFKMWICGIWLLFAWWPAVPQIVGFKRLLPDLSHSVHLLLRPGLVNLLDKHYSSLFLNSRLPFCTLALFILFF